MLRVHRLRRSFLFILLRSLGLRVRHFLLAMDFLKSPAHAQVVAFFKLVILSFDLLNSSEIDMFCGYCSASSCSPEVCSAST